MNQYNFTYSSKFHYLCVQNCVSQVLNYLGHCNAHHYINCAIEFCVTPQYGITDYIPFVHKKMSEIVIAPINHSVQLKTVVSSRNAWRINKEILDKNNIFIAIVDVYYLSYRKEFRKIHGAHAVIVTGYQADKDLVTIYDWYEPYFYEGNISLDEFFAARSSSNPKDDNPYSGWPIYNKWIEITPSFTEYPKAECLYINIRKSLSNNIYRNNEKGRVLRGVDALTYILQTTSNQSISHNFWRSLHNDMFSISRLFSLLLSNFSEMVHEYNWLIEDLEFLESYNIIFQEMLYVILKSSIKGSSRLTERFQLTLCQFIKKTSSLYSRFERICNDLAFNNFLPPTNMV